jgi:hypothetical protein
MSPDQFSGRWSESTSVLEPPPRQQDRLPPEWQIVAALRNPVDPPAQPVPRILVRRQEPSGTPIWFVLFSVTVAVLAGLILITFAARVAILGRDGGSRSAAAPTIIAAPAPTAIESVRLEPTPTPIPAPSVATAASPSIVDTGGGNAMLRSGPSLQAGIVERLANGSPVTELGQESREGSRTWRQIQSATGNAGWIDASLIRRGTAAPTAADPARRI